MESLVKSLHFLVNSNKKTLESDLSKKQEYEEADQLGSFLFSENPGLF